LTRSITQDLTTKPIIEKTCLQARRWVAETRRITLLPDTQKHSAEEAEERCRDAWTNGCREPKDGVQDHTDTSDGAFASPTGGTDANMMPSFPVAIMDAPGASISDDSGDDSGADASGH